MDKPSVGRIVHYVAFGTPGGEYPAGVCRSAMITEVNMLLNGEVVQINEKGEQTNVGLVIFNPTGQFFNRSVSYDGGVPRCVCGQTPEHAVHSDREWAERPDTHDPHDVKVRHLPGTWHWPERV